MYNKQLIKKCKMQDINIFNDSKLNFYIFTIEFYNIYIIMLNTF